MTKFHFLGEITDDMIEIRKCERCGESNQECYYNGFVDKWICPSCNANLYGFDKGEK